MDRMNTLLYNAIEMAISNEVNNSCKSYEDVCEDYAKELGSTVDELVAMGLVDLMPRKRTEYDTNSYIDMIVSKAKKDEQIKADKERREKKSRESASAVIHSYKDRIANMWKVKDAAEIHGIKLNKSGWGGHEGYDTGMFYSNGWSHLLGFVSDDRCGACYGYIGILAGGACGCINFYTNGEEIFGYNTSTKQIVEPKTVDLNYCAENIERFESEFYAYIEKNCK